MTWVVFTCHLCSSERFQRRKDAFHVKINVSPCRVPVVSMCDLGRAVADAVGSISLEFMK